MSEQKDYSEGFSFFKLLSSLYEKFISVFQRHDKQNVNSAIVDLGRTPEEKAQLQEMCEEIDDYHRCLAELRESKLSPGEWLERKIDTEVEELEKSGKLAPEVSEDAKDELKRFVYDQFSRDIESQTDALNEELDQTVEIAKGGAQ